MTENFVEVEYVDYGAQGEYDIFGKVVARSDVRGMTAEEIETEIREMTEILGNHIVARKVELVGPVR